MTKRSLQCILTIPIDKLISLENMAKFLNTVSILHYSAYLSTNQVDNAHQKLAHISKLHYPLDVVTTYIVKLEATISCLEEEINPTLDA